jgi:hypothetical protein
VSDRNWVGHDGLASRERAVPILTLTPCAIGRDFR